MKNLTTKIFTWSLVLLGLTMTSCLNDLDQSDPQNTNLLSGEALFKDSASYQQFLAKLYAGLATTGQQGPDGQADVSGIDEGFSQYIRGYWNLQELTTDEAIIAWNDQTIKDLHSQTWGASDVFINALFSRLDFQVKNCNEFLRQTTEDKLTSRGVTSELRTQIEAYRAEARFLRALSYWHFVDLFGSVGLVTEASSTEYFLPEQASRQEIFDYVESELLDIENILKEPHTNVYPRVDKGAAWMLLAKLYMNAGVYFGADRNVDAFNYVNKLVTSNYSLSPKYQNLFLADNDTNGAQNEFIFAIAYDGQYTKTFGGTTYLTHAAVGGSMNAADFGINGGWGGIRTTSAFVNKFVLGSDDQREQFYTDEQTLEIKNVSDFQQGYAISKWKNVNVNGVAGSDSTGDFVDIDFPMFRLADAYLMYAELFVRGAGGTQSDALNYLNLIRARAYGNSSGNISSSDLNLDFILDERARELHWEGHRRTDLIRFGKFTGSSYLWPWKGNVQSGAPTQPFRRLFPIPSPAIAGNPNLKQNPGY
ncbi:MAG: RagB/SusD family nutrient uptake outer membrane protein [Gelidibacter sp.]